MKKRIIMFAVIVGCMFINGCGTKTSEGEQIIVTGEKDQTVDTSVQETTTEEVTTEIYTGPEAIGFFQPDNMAGGKKRVEEYWGLWTVGKDILSIEVVPSGEEHVAGTTLKGLWTEYWNENQQTVQYKIGFSIEFDTVNEGKIERTILEPDDIYGFLDYVEVYIYDDVNITPGMWYSHLLQEEMTEDTLISSIKLTCGKNIDQVSNLKISAFAYKGDKDFDQQGKYIGGCQVTCPINRTN